MEPASRPAFIRKANGFRIATPKDLSWGAESSISGEVSVWHLVALPLPTRTTLEEVALRRALIVTGLAAAWTRRGSGWSPSLNNRASVAALTLSVLLSGLGSGCMGEERPPEQKRGMVDLEVPGGPPPSIPPDPNVDCSQGCVEKDGKWVPVDAVKRDTGAAAEPKGRQ
jgi:hypothetical protein